MSRNGNGTYNLPAGNPVVTGTTISSTWANNTLADMANAITGSIAADGQTTITGPLKGPNGTVAFAGVGQTRIPVGTTAQRAATPLDGMIRYNTDLQQYEGYRNGSWSIFGNGAGGTLFSDTVTATQGQTVINTPTGYVQGGDNLSVFVNGSRQIYNVNYTETTTDSFTFNTGLNAGDLVNYTIGASTSLSVNAASVLYNEGGTGAVNRNVEEKLQESVSVKDFGATGDGTTDDYAAIQTAIEYAFANNVNILFPKATYAVGATLLIPQNFDPTFTGQNPIVTIEGGNSIFNMLDNITLFESAYYNAGVLTSNYGTALDSHYSTNIVLQNFSVIYADSGNLTVPLLKIQDWHQGCVIQNIVTNVNEEMLWSNNNFYTNFLNLQSYLQAPAAGDRFTFSNAHNLNKISGLVAANSIIGYKFDGALTACQMTNVSFEGMEIGAQFNATVYDLSIENSYFEGITDSFLQFTDYVENCYINNNYFNFLNSATTYLIDYFPSPGNGIYITSGNNYTGMPSNANILKQKENVYGTGIVIQRVKTGGTINDLLITNTTAGQNVDWQQKIAMTGAVGNVVNTYAPGIYSGKYSNGIAGANGFSWTNLSSGTVQINTKMLYNNSLRIYVNIAVSATGTTFIKGEFIGGYFGATFYEYGASALTVTTALNITNVGGYVQINGTVSGTITAIDGEIRLI